MDIRLVINQKSIVHSDEEIQYISNLLSNDRKILNMTIDYKHKVVNYGVICQLDQNYEYYGPDFAKAVETFGALE